MATVASGNKSTSGSFELKVIVLLAIGSGLMGLDRFIIYPLFPILVRDLHFDYKDLGLVSMGLSLGWGFAAALIGPLSDHFGRKAILVPSALAFSLLVGLSGLASGLLSLVLIRIIMGIAEGAFLPAAISSIAEASHPKRAGLNNGILIMSSTLCGLVLGPQITLGLMHVLPNWHWVFGIVAIPGLIATWMIWQFLPKQFERHVAYATEIETFGYKSTFPIEDPRPLLRYSAIWVLALCMICWLICQVVLTAFMPSYLTDHLHFSPAQMGACLSALGVGSIAGMVIIPAIADYFGHKLMVIITVLLAVPVLVVFPWLHSVPAVFCALIYVMFACGGATVITCGVFTIHVVPSRLTGAASGFVVGVGEILGGAATPAATGFLAKHYGIPVVVRVVLIACVAALVLVLVGVRTVKARKETTPAVAAS